MPTDIARRRFLSALGVAAAWPLATHAQQSGKIPRVGVLPTGYRQSDPEGQARIGAFTETLGKLGWSDGRNIRLEVRWPNTDNNDRISAETAALVESAPDILVISSNSALAARLKLARSIPTVFVQISDPVGSGFVGSISHPG